MRAVVEFNAPILFDQEIDVGVRVAKLDRSSVTFERSNVDNGLNLQPANWIVFFRFWRSLTSRKPSLRAPPIIEDWRRRPIVRRLNRLKPDSRPDLRPASTSLDA
jgi:hypothetical protein